VILVVSATAAEVRDFVVPSGVRLVHCGIGPVEAAIVTTDALARERYDMVINAGIAGVFRGRGAVGDSCVVAHEVMAELGIETRQPLTLPSGVVLETEAFADAALVERGRAAGLKVGRGITVSSITASAATASRLSSMFGADVEAMEGFAVLRAAALAGVPAVEIRGISNFVGEHSDREWDFSGGMRATVAALDAFLSAVRV
jgi:futalosine hydrolase